MLKIDFYFNTILTYYFLPVPRNSNVHHTSKMIDGYHSVEITESYSHGS